MCGFDGSNVATRPKADARCSSAARLQRAALLSFATRRGMTSACFRRMSLLDPDSAATRGLQSDAF